MLNMNNKRVIHLTTEDEQQPLKRVCVNYPVMDVIDLTSDTEDKLSDSEDSDDLFASDSEDSDDLFASDSNDSDNLFASDDEDYCIFLNKKIYNEDSVDGESTTTVQEYELPDLCSDLIKEYLIETPSTRIKEAKQALERESITFMKTLPIDSARTMHMNNENDEDENEDEDEELCLECFRKINIKTVVGMVCGHLVCKECFITKALLHKGVVHCGDCKSKNHKPLVVSFV